MESLPGKTFDRKWKRPFTAFQNVVAPARRRPEI